MNPLRLFSASTLSAMLYLPCCSRGEGELAPSAADRDADAMAVDIRAMGAVRLDALRSRQATALCEEDGRRRDVCIELGLAYGSETECYAAVEQCRATLGDTGISFDCTSISFGSSGQCSVTVDEYLACVDAWSAALSCQEVGRMILPPDPCEPVLSGCPHLEGQFFRNGTPPPCDPAAGANEPADDNDDVHGFDGCRPVPARFVVLGDSIAYCLFSPDVCSRDLIAEHLRSTIAPDLAYESYAVSGARVADLLGQAQNAAGGPGHVLVWLWSIGNDLVERELNYDAWEAAFRQVFDYFTDTARFPDGATFLLNTQYSPYDQCLDPLGDDHTGISPEDEQFLRDVNQRMFLDVAVSRSDTVAIDHYPDWLGHGDNASILGCPHCGADNTGWVADYVHPNALGHMHIAGKRAIAFGRMYGASCRP